MLQETARAKINLSLHVTGRRPDGYHTLDSLVVFTAFGDSLEAAPAETLSLRISGPFANHLQSDGANLVLQAARTLAPGQGAALHLTKNLPVASGIGGGSADAACALRLLCEMWNVPPPPDGGLALGADVPVCLQSEPCRMSGIGDFLSPVPELPPLTLLLVNNGAPISTGTVFSALAQRENLAMPQIPSHFVDAIEFARWLRGCRNDLETAALSVEPSLERVVAALRADPSCLLVRMSGSGGTFFGLYACPVAAEAAQKRIAERYPDWWVVATPAVRPSGYTGYEGL